MLRDLPTLIAALTVVAYWIGVITMVAKRRLRYRRTTSGIVPQVAGEQHVWPLWIAVVTVWIVSPIRAINQTTGFWSLPAWAMENSYALGVRWGAAIVGLAGLLATIHCWRRMGRNWSVVVVPGERNELVTSGLFRFVRHPIYALSAVVMASTAVVVPVWPMIVALVTHAALMYYKAHSEEQFLVSLHGHAYVDYRNRTGRFMPRLVANVAEPSYRKAA